MRSDRPRRRIRWALILTYLLALLASHGVQAARSPARAPLGPHGRLVVVPQYQGDTILPRSVEVAVDVFDDAAPAAPWLVLLHGSPGAARDFAGLIPRLQPRRRILAVDLPGFGRSDHGVADYSFRSHGNEVLAVMDSLGIDAADVLGFSMGGGVALSMSDRAPSRVRSLVLLSSLGVQEMELLGNHDANHLLHSAQWWGLRILFAVVPHFGAWGYGGLDLPYARNFLDSDQRVLRTILAAYEGPALILHGDADPLVPVGAALEHHRLVPQSRLALREASHFLLWSQTGWVADETLAFLDAVDAGRAPRRGDADAERVAAVLGEPDRGALRTQGFALVLLATLIVLGTFVSEDLTCISTGLLISLGRLDFGLGLALCFCGIIFGDLLLYAAGRIWGPRITRRTPFSWVLGEDRLRYAAAWFERRGAIVIFLTRFIPGLRLPTYVAAGVVRARFVVFLAYFLVAVALWTPLIVGLSTVAGGRSLEFVERYRALSLWLAGGVAVVLLLLLRLLPSLLSWRGRRRWVGRWRRIRHWEFWPPWAFYPPVVLHVLGLAWKYRSLGLVTAANPSIPSGGFLGESKSEILALFGDDSRLARWTRLHGPTRTVAARESLASIGGGFPVVLKPDVGERGVGVRILRDAAALELALAAIETDQILQEYVDGAEFGVFVVRDPGQPGFRIFSLTRKQLPELVGDGRSTLDHLIHGDPRAVCLADAYLRAQARDIDRVVPAGERVRLVELGTHCRGAIFLDGSDLITPELTAAVDDLARRAPGFHFGRFDLRAPSEQALREGRELKVLELNGVTSEATHIYDPRYGVGQARAVLRQQWSSAFAIAAANRDHGARPLSTWGLVRLILER